jgi:hypothetical protein
MGSKTIGEQLLRHGFDVVHQALVEVVRQIDLEFNCTGDKGDVAQGNVQALSSFAFTGSLQPTSSEYSKIGCGRPIR